MSIKQILDQLAATAYASPDPLRAIDELRWELRNRVFRAALEASGWSSQRAAETLGRTTSTVQSALETHHHELERERLRRLVELGRVDRRG